MSLIRPSMDLPTAIEVARAIAIIGHRGQTRHNGEPYVTHCDRVVEAVEDKLKPAAWLHDIIEDTEINVIILNQIFSDEIINLVLSLTYDESCKNLFTKDGWMDNMLNCGKRDTLIIKVADMKDNLAGQPFKNAKIRYTKYIPLFEAKIKELQ